jgi:signal-transduction protein with cAMP-binding, CBS, and nucleotidyltransferase domain
VIHKLQPDSLENIFPRLNAQVVSETRLTLSNSDNGFAYLLLHRVKFLRECSGFDGLSKEVLVEIAKELDLNSLNTGDEFLIKRNDVHYAFMIIFEGKAEIKISEEKATTFAKKDIIYSDILIEDNTYSLKALTDLKFYSLDQELLNALMFDHIEFRNAVLGLVEIT